MWEKRVKNEREISGYGGRVSDGQKMEKNREREEEVAGPSAVNTNEEE